MDDGTWLSGLSGLSPDEISFGIAKCIDRGDPWPPSLPEFRVICQDLPDVRKMALMVMQNINHPIAKKIRQRLGSYNVDSLCGGAWTIKYLEGQIKMEYENMMNISSTHNEVKELTAQISHEVLN